jgi:hypothetical protein
VVRIIATLVGGLILLGGFVNLTSRPLNSLFFMLMGLALILAMLAPGLIAHRVPALRYVPGGAGVALGLIAFLAFVGAVATSPTPPPGTRPTATAVAQAAPTGVPTTLPTVAPTASALATATSQATAPPTPAPDTRLAGQVRYIANTEGQGVKLRTACDDQAGSVGWPEGTSVTVVYARADCPDWLLVKRSEDDGSWVRVAYLSEAAPTAVPVAPAPPTATTVQSTAVAAAASTAASAPAKLTTPPKPAAPTATSVASKPESKATVTSFSSGGLGLLRAEWERAKGRPSRELPGGFLEYQVGSLVVAFRDDRVWYIERVWGDRAAVTMDEARRQSKMLIPQDAEPDSTYGLDSVWWTSTMRRAAWP